MYYKLRNLGKIVWRGWGNDKGGMWGETKIIGFGLRRLRVRELFIRENIVEGITV